MTQEENDNRKWLAAEYALGALDRDTMLLAEKLYDEDGSFRAAVDGWQNELTPMLEEVPEAIPDQKVWDNIAARTGTAEKVEASGIWSDLNFWRGFSLLSASLAAASIAGLLFYANGSFVVPDSRPGPLVATLNASGETPLLLARFDPESGSLILRAALPSQQQNKSAELWLIPAGGVPKSLGLLESAFSQITLSSENLELIEDGGALAISLEPEGGSPTGSPTGPVIASGKLRNL